MMVNAPPKMVVDRIDRAMRKVFWAGKKRGLTKIDVPERPLDEGGWGLPNFRAKVIASRLMWVKKWHKPAEERPLWADVLDRLVIRTSKKPDDKPRVSTLTQTWEEKKTHKSKLPKELRDMMQTARDFNVEINVLKFSGEAKEQDPIWQSKTTDLDAKTERSAAMKHLREYHRVSNLKDIKSLNHQRADGCKHHHRCMKAVDLITVKTVPKFNIRYQTPVNQLTGKSDGLDHTARRLAMNKVRWKEGKRFCLNPDVKHKGPLTAATRIFAPKGQTERIPADRPQETAPNTHEITVYTDGSADKNGTPRATCGAGVWSDHEEAIASFRVAGEPQTNNRGELAAVVWALNQVPANVELSILTDSMYVVNGLAHTHKEWEDNGWRGVRVRTAETWLEKVPAHTGIYGNEQADLLAKEGSEKVTPEVIDTSVPAEWELSGARLDSLSFRKMYDWVRAAARKQSTTTAPQIIEEIKVFFEENEDPSPTAKDVWRSIRIPEIRGEVTDFLWAAIHGRSPCGVMFAKWGPGWEELQFCECGAVETMRHIQTECGDALWRYRIWDEAGALLKSSKLLDNLNWEMPAYEQILGVGLKQFKDKATKRLYVGVVSETAFTIWKLRNRARFDNLRISTAVAINVWKHDIETKASRDLAIANLKGPKTEPERKRAKEMKLAWLSTAREEDRFDCIRRALPSHLVPGEVPEPLKNLSTQENERLVRFHHLVEEGRLPSDGLANMYFVDEINKILKGEDAQCFCHQVIRLSKDGRFGYVAGRPVITNERPTQNPPTFILFTLPSTEDGRSLHGRYMWVDVALPPLTADDHQYRGIPAALRGRLSGENVPCTGIAFHSFDENLRQTVKEVASLPISSSRFPPLPPASAIHASFPPLPESAPVRGIESPALDDEANGRTPAKVLASEGEAVTQHHGKLGSNPTVVLGRDPEEYRDHRQEQSEERVEPAEELEH
ncbi:hypothetical protein FRC01_006803, partial [Tulasnella sp. 417]